MKKPTSSLLVLASLLLANGLLANGPDHGNTITHNHPKFTAVVTNYTFDDGTTVEKTITENDSSTSDTAKYKVVITKTIAGPVTYSLLTMGIQSKEHVVQITSATVDSGKDTPTFCLPDKGDAALASKLQPFMVNPTNSITTDSGTVLDIDKIGFVGFSGKTCTIEFVVVARKVVGNTYWAKPVSALSPTGMGHDNTPPN